MGRWWAKQYIELLIYFSTEIKCVWRFFISFSLKKESFQKFIWHRSCLRDFNMLSKCQLKLNHWVSFRKLTTCCYKLRKYCLSFTRDLSFCFIFPILKWNWLGSLLVCWHPSLYFAVLWSSHEKFCYSFHKRPPF